MERDRSIATIETVVLVVLAALVGTATGATTTCTGTTACCLDKKITDQTLEFAWYDFGARIIPMFQ